MLGHAIFFLQKLWNQIELYSNWHKVMKSTPALRKNAAPELWAYHIRSKKILYILIYDTCQKIGSNQPNSFFRSRQFKK